MPPKPITQKNTNLQEKPISFLSTGECRRSIIAFIAEESLAQTCTNKICLNLLIVSKEIIASRCNVELLLYFLFEMGLKFEERLA